MKQYLFGILILIMAIFSLGGNLNKYFVGHHDWNGVHYGNMARNYLRYGFLNTKFGQVTNYGIVPAEQFSFNTHYPPLFPVLLAVSQAVFGDNETAIRLVPWLITGGSVLILYLICRQLKLSLLAAFASSVIVFTPMLRYFSHMPTHEHLSLLFSLISVYLYLLFTSQPKSKNYLKLVFITILNSLSSWPGYFIYPLLTLHAFIFHRRLFKKISLLVFITLLVFLLHLLHVYLLTGSMLGGGLIEIFLSRLNLPGTADPTLPVFSWLKYLIQEARWLTVYYTRPIIIAGLIGFVYLCFRRSSYFASILLIWLIFGFAYPLIFSNAVFIHDYLNIFFYPFFSLSLALIVNWLSQKNTALALCFLILIGLIVFFERLPFYQANQQSNMHLTGYQLGRFINQSVPKTATAIVYSNNYANHHGAFISYYADRQIYYYNYDLTDLQESFQDHPEVSHWFTVQSHCSQDLIVDQALATQSGTVQANLDFIHYQIK